MAAPSVSDGAGRTRRAGLPNGLSRPLCEDFAHCFTMRKPREQFCLLIVNEFSALARNSGMAARIEQARGFNVALTLAPQVVQGMGEENQAERILGSVETLVCHRVNTPEEIVTLAGTRQRLEYSTHYGPDGATGEGSAPIQHQFKVNPNKVRALAPGVAYVISRGRAMRVQVLKAPDLRGELPTIREASGTPPARSRDRDVAKLPF